MLGLSIVLGLATAGLAVAPLWLVLEPHQLIDAMPRYLQRTGIAVAASLNLVPQVARSFVNVREAERLRGGAGGMRGFFELLLPVTLTTLEDSLGLAEAMEARGYGSGPRSSFAGTSWAYRDWLIAAAAGAALAIFVLSLFAGLNPSWDPSVRLSPPAVSPVALLACLLLAVPALLTSA